MYEELLLIFKVFSFPKNQMLWTLFFNCHLSSLIHCMCLHMEETIANLSVLPVSHNSSAVIPQRGCSTVTSSKFKTRTRAFLLWGRKSLHSSEPNATAPRTNFCKEGEVVFDHHHGWISWFQAVVLEQWGQGAFVGGKCLWDEVRYSSVFVWTKLKQLEYIS